MEIIGVFVFLIKLSGVVSTQWSSDTPEKTPTSIQPNVTQTNNNKSNNNKSPKQYNKVKKLVGMETKFLKSIS